MIPMSRLRMIPREFHVAHKFSYYLHDLLAEVVIHGEQSAIFETTIRLRARQDAEELRKCAPDELFDWLKKHDYLDELREIICRQCLVALLSDMCHFIYEALAASEKGKLTISYVLLRKPLKDNLFYLEWILADREEFVECFLKGALENLDQSRLSSRDRLEIIRKACSNAPYSTWLDPELIHELRFDKKCERGLAGICDKAHHLITTNRSIRTEDGNFNLVFSNNEDRFSQWEMLYTILPLVLMHSVEIVEGLLARMDALHEPEATLRRMQRLLGWAYIELGEPSSKRTGGLRKVAKAVAGDLDLKCRNCGKKHRLDGSNLLRFFLRCRLRCSNCARIEKLPTGPHFGYCVLDEAELVELEAV